ncbi:MAG: hypothetical protein ACRD0C_14150 [Acidimicrobiia bacterium]
MPMPDETVVAEVRDQARALEASPGFPGPLAARVRAATAWMGAGNGAPDDVRFAAHLVARQANRQLEPPAVAGGGLRRLVKVAVVALVGWYGRFLGRHLGAVGQAFSRLGLAVADRVDRLEADQAGELDALRAEVEELRARLADLEAGRARNEPAAPSPR